MNRSYLTFFALVIVTAQSFGADKPAPVFKAGAATSIVTPPLGVPLVGSVNAQAATHIHDDLHARCLALDDGSTRLIFVVVDNLTVNREVFDEAKRVLHETTGVPPQHMMMSATHTHSGPSARGINPLLHTRQLDDYQAFLSRRIVEGVTRAIHHLEPARIAWGTGQMPQHVFNRRWLLKDGKTVTNPFGDQDRAIMNPGRRPDLFKPAGPTNPELSLISVQSTSGRPIALLANYWLHYVGGVPADHISADYFGAFCLRIQELLKTDDHTPPFVGILANGPCADVNNVNIQSPPQKTDEPYQRMKQVADELAQEALRVQKTLKHRDWVELKGAQSELELQVRHPTPAQIQRAQEVLARPTGTPPVHPREVTYAKRTLDARDWPPSVSVLLQTFRIGELGIAAVPFEVFTETGLEIKARSPLKPTFTIELANGGYGYLPTPEQHELGGYESWLGTNRVEKDATRKIVARLMELFAQVQPAAAKPASVTLDPIFNGKDLSGWEAPTPNPFWSVEQGVLVGVNDDKLTGSTLWSTQKYGDFALEFDVRWTGDMDSGVMFREPRSKLQMQIGISRSLQRDMTASFWVSKAGYPAEGQAPQAAQVLKPGDWNTLRLEARGTTYTSWLNGRQVGQYTNDQFTAPGSFGLHVHANLKMKVEFRNLRAKALP